ATAAHWLAAAADQGDPAAQNDLGRAYDLGLGLPRDVAQAIDWYRRAAEQDYPPAQFNLALKLQAGDGLPADAEAARALFASAADQGHPPAMLNLGIMLANAATDGEGLVEAYAWIRIAVDAGVPNAFEALRTLGQAMTDDQIEAGQALAAERPTVRF
ncbi:MAG: tetratricopeptide repeat protein, partial [Alphaproteobacteria bacterium]